MIVAIDGPAGTGKGTISKLVAGRLGFTYIDTGAMYRCVTLKMLENNIAPDDDSKIEEMFKDTTITFENQVDENQNFSQKVYLDGRDVSTDIRTEEVSKYASPYSKNLVIRAKLLEMQRAYANEADIIMEGRDITTVVFPNAELKIYLDATTEERANRRYKENIEKGIDTTYEKTLEDIKERDYRDMHRDVAPLMVAEGAVVIDTTNLSIEEVYSKVKELIDEKQNEV
jgi:cytidylate kinase